MNRKLLSLLALVFATFAVSCERHPASELGEHEAIRSESSVPEHQVPTDKTEHVEGVTPAQPAAAAAEKPAAPSTTPAPAPKFFN